MHALTVHGRSIAQDGVECVSGNVEVDVCTIDLDAAWDGLMLSVVFVGSGKSVEVAWDGTSQITVPWEVLVDPGYVSVTVIGRDADGTMVRITEAMARPLHVVQAGAESGDEPSEATMTRVDQAVADATAATSAATKAATSANNAATAANAAADRANAAAESAISSILRYDSSTGRYDNASIESWLLAQDDGKAYGISIPKSASTVCTKTGANAGIANPVPGIIGRPAVDPYKDLGAFRYYEVNGGVDSDGVPYVTAFSADGNFSRTDADVWILAPNLYWAHSETDDAVEISVSDSPLAGMDTQPQGILPSGERRPYILYAKYWLGEDGYSRSGQKADLFDVSHNTLITKMSTATTGYSGLTHADYWYTRLMFLLKYATKNSQSVFYGVCDYNVDVAVSVATASQSYAVVSNSDAAKFLVGSTVSVGSRDGYKSDNRQEACTRDLADRVTITAIETHDDNNKRLVLDADAFTTTTSAHVVTMPYCTGACDGVEGDGSPYNPLSGKEPFVCQGIEQGGGFYEVAGNFIYHSTGSGWGVYVNVDSKDEKTAYDSSVYADTGLKLPSGDGVYALYPGVSDQGVLVQQGLGGSTSSGLCDAKWGYADTESGDREARCFGGLGEGAGAGAFFVSAWSGLGGAWWNCGSRASTTGRGVRSA
jgi:hypothetical protein